MNALVADQMARLRDLMGDPKIATKLMRTATEGSRSLACTPGEQSTTDGMQNRTQS